MKYIMMGVTMSSSSAHPLHMIVPVLFSSTLIHRDVFLGTRTRLMSMGSVSIISAGEVHFGRGTASCSGFSETLDVESRGLEDARLIDGIDYLSIFDGPAPPPRRRSARPPLPSQKTE